MFNFASDIFFLYTMNGLTIVIAMIGGLALFLYGINLMSDGVNRSTGRKLRKMLQSFTRNRFSALVTGAISTSLIQSSSAVSVMAISLVKAGILRFPQTFGILLGAGIGTTITAQIIAFDITDFALLVFAAGFFLNIASSNNLLKTSGAALMGFGLLFYGLQLMSEAVSPLRDYQPFLDFLTTMENPVAGVAAGFVFTAIIQSSGAFIGIIIVLSSQGLIGLEAGVALLLGSNIGTTITAVIAALNAGFEAKRVAVSFFMIKLAGVLIVIWWIPSYARLVEVVTSWMTDSGEAALPRQIANAHTLFNIMVTVSLLPLAHAFPRWIMTLVPEKEKKKAAPVRLEFLDESFIPTPPIAISLAKKEAMHMGGLVREMIEDAIKPFFRKDKVSLQSIKLNEAKVDFLRKEIAIYITRISQGRLAPKMVEESFQLLYIISELEQIADVVSGPMAEKAAEWMESEKEFSEEGSFELKDFHARTLDQFDKTLIAVDSLDRKKAADLEESHRKYRQLADELKHRHFERLTHNIPESVSTSKMHMEVMSALRAIHSHMGNVVRIIAGRNDKVGQGPVKID